MSTSAMFPGLPGMSDALQEAFSSPPPEPDWSDREAAIAYLLEAERPYAGPRGLDEPAMRELLGVVYDRSINPASAFNHFQVDGSDLPRDRLGEIAVPTLVIHGADDPFFQLPHGQALADAIPGARLLVIDGMGHGSRAGRGTRSSPRWSTSRRERAERDLLDGAVPSPVGQRRIGEGGSGQPIAGNVGR